MRQDRYAKIALTLLTVGVWVLALAQLESPARADGTIAGAVAAGPVSAVAPQAEQGKRGPSPASPPPAAAPTSTKPLAWRVAWAHETIIGTSLRCSTAVIVTNTGNSLVYVDVEWFDFLGASLALKTADVAALTQRVFTTGLSASDQYPSGSIADVGAFKGYANVNSDDPRIMVAAFQYCRGWDNSRPFAHQTNIPAYPVGTTAAFFVAGMPGMAAMPPATPPALPNPER